MPVRQLQAVTEEWSDENFPESLAFFVTAFILEHAKIDNDDEDGLEEFGTALSRRLYYESRARGDYRLCDPLPVAISIAELQRHGQAREARAVVTSTVPPARLAPLDRCADWAELQQEVIDDWPRIPPGRHVTPEQAATQLQRKLREIARDAGKGIDEFLDNSLFWLEHEVMIAKVWNHAHRIRFGDVRRGDITSIADAVRWHGMSIEVATERYFRRRLN
jgi:hypothetical protein